MSTSANGINSLGQIVGSYEDSNGNGHGFLKNGSNYNRIDDPSPKSEVEPTSSVSTTRVTSWAITSGNGERGFLLSGGKYTTISFPDSVDTDVTGINQLGQIVGYYVDTAGNDHGFLYQDGRFTEIEFPGGQSTDPYGINAQGEIVGVYAGAPSPPPPCPSRPPSSC